MPDGDTDQLSSAEHLMDELANEDVRVTARRAVTFLVTCVDGEVANATVSDRIAAARTLLEHAARPPDLLGEVAALADLTSKEDVALIVAALE